MLDAVKIPEQLNIPGARFCRVKPGTKIPHGDEWQKNVFLADEMRDWLSSGWNYGVVAGFGNILSLDADHPEMAAHLSRVLPETLHVKTPSGGYHWHLLCTPAVPWTQAFYELRRRATPDDDPAVVKDGFVHLGELRVSGCQTVGPNSIRTDGEYVIVEDAPLAEISQSRIWEVVEDFIAIDFFHSKERKEFEGTSDDMGLDIVKVCQTFSVKLTETRSGELRGSHPVHGSTTGTNFWISPEKKCWHCFRHGTGGGVLSLIAVGENIIPCEDARQGVLRGDLFKKTLEIAKSKYGAIIPESDKETRTPFTFTHIGDIKIKPSDYVIKNLIESDSLNDIFGDPASYKTFFVIDQALCVVTGTPFHGLRVKQGPVFYIAGEGRNGLSRRIKAWEKHHGIKIDSFPFYLSDSSANLTDAQNPIDVADAIESLISGGAQAPVLVVIDTLARNFGPGNENDTVDMNKFIHGLDVIRERFKCAIIVIHHCGLSDKSRARGGSSFFGALDAEYRLAKDPQGIMTLSCTKMKDHEKPENMFFKLKQIDLGIFDENDESVTSCVLENIDASEVQKAQDSAVLPAKKQVAFDVLTAEFARRRRNLEASGHDPDGARISLDEWKGLYLAGLTGKEKHAALVNFTRTVADCESKGLVKFERGYVLLTEGRQLWD